MNSATKQLSSGQAELQPLIAVVMGSDSDLKTLKPAIDILQEFGLKVSVRILSAHRTPIEMVHFAKEAESS